MEIELSVGLLVVTCYVRFVTLAVDPCKVCTCSGSEVRGPCITILKDIPKPLPGNATKIVLNDHQMGIIRRDDFSNLTDLNHLTLNYDGIKYVEEGAFSDLGNLFWLELANNNLVVLSRSHFVGLQSLAHLNIENNTGLLLLPCSLSALPLLAAFVGHHTRVTFSVELFVHKGCPEGTIPALNEISIYGTDTRYIDPTLFSLFSDTLVYLGVGQQGIEIRSVMDTLDVTSRLSWLVLNELPASFYREMNITHLTKLFSLSIMGTYCVPTIHHATVQIFQLAFSSVPAVHARAFEQMPSLTTLRLFSNLQLSVIDVDSLQELTFLNTFELITSNIRMLPEGVFSGINLSHIHLEDNRWSCDCHMTWLVDLLESPDLSSRLIDDTCSSPPRLAGRSIDSLTPDELMSYCPVCLVNWNTLALITFEFLISFILVFLCCKFCFENNVPVAETNTDLLESIENHKNSDHDYDATE